MSLKHFQLGLAVLLVSTSVAKAQMGAGQMAVLRASLLNSVVECRLEAGA